MIFCRFVVVLIFVCSSCAFGASFNCAKSFVKIEKLICENSEISKLDEELAHVYATLKKKEKSSLVDDQRRWLKDIRNSCNEESCVLNAYKMRINDLSDRLNCVGAESKILGRWSNKTNGYFEEMLFSSKDGVRKFGSWRHHNPEFFGTWKLIGCSLNITGLSNYISFDYIINIIEKSKLDVVNEDGEEELYSR